MQDDEKNGQRGERSIVAARRIRDMIVAGELAAGSRIGERNITEQLGISRTPLREAFKILEAEGLVRIEPNRGATVVKLSLCDVEESIELLIGLEGAAAELACIRALKGEIDAIESLHMKMVVAYKQGDLMDYFHLNQAIHQQIVDCAHNDALSRVYRTESARIRRYRFAGNQEPARWARAVLEHEQLLDALKQHEGAILRETLRAHHTNGWKSTRKILERELEAG